MADNYQHFNKAIILNFAKECIVTISFLSIFGYSLIKSPFAFNFEIYEHGYYFISLITITSVFLNSLLAILDREYKLNYYDLILLIILLFQIYLLRNGNEYASVIVSVTIQFFLLKSIRLEILKLIMYIVFASYVTEFLFVCYSYLINNSFKLVGSLHNTGVFSIYISLFIPLTYYVMKRKLSNIYFRTLFFLFVLIALTIIINLKSRTSIITLVVVFCVPYLFNYLKKEHIYVRTFFITILCLGSAYLFKYLFFLKSASSTGRLLMLEVSISHLPENFWLGVGLGKFTQNYPNWQADFFKNSVNSDVGYFLNAGDSYVIFNEFLQLFLTIGFIGFFILVLCLFHFFSRKPLIESALCEMIKYTLMIILFSSLTYYTIHINVVLLLISLFMAIWLKITKPPNIIIIKGAQTEVIKLLICLSSFATFAYNYEKYDAINKWWEIKNGLNSSEDKFNPDNNKIYAILNNDGKFLAEYGNYLYENGYPLTTAISCLEKSKGTFISNQTIEDLAYLYLEQKKFNNAIKNFEWLVNYTPSRFSYRLELIKLYIKISAANKAKKLAEFTLEMPIKIPSSEVVAIKKEISFLHQQLLTDN